MSKPEKLCIDDKEYYLANDLFKYDRNFFIGCAKTVRLILEKKDIPQDMYAYISSKQGIWGYSTEKFKKAKLAISTKWIEENMPSMSNGLIQEEYEIEPKQIVLSSNEMMMDDIIIDVKMVGEREYDKCFFKVKTVEKFFDSPHLAATILRHENEGYFEGKHYTYFIRRIIDRNDNSPNARVLYLTYVGLIRFLFSSRNKKAELFQEWAAKILFTHQVGTKEQKNRLVKSLMGIDANNAIEMLQTSASTISCVYLLVLGTVEKLRDKMNIDDKWEDTSYVCKYGETDDLRRRIGEHKKKYSKYCDNIRLKYYIPIDTSKTTKAEVSIKNKFEDMHVICKLVNQKELLILTEEQLKQSDRIYEETGILFGAEIKEYKSQTESKITEIEHQNSIDILKLKSELELCKKELEISKKEREKELELSKKDIKILIMEKEALQSKVDILERKNKKLVSKYKS
jgi:hypothetical protein